MRKSGARRGNNEVIMDVLPCLDSREMTKY
jgi:hypothetical protein